MKNRINKRSSDTQDQDAHTLYFTDQISVNEVARLYVQAPTSDGKSKESCPMWESVFDDPTKKKNMNS